MPPREVGDTPRANPDEVSRMVLILSFWANWDLSPEDAEAHVRRQAEDWAIAEPKVIDWKIVRVWPDDETRTRWAVEMALEFHPIPAQQPTLWGAA